MKTFAYFRKRLPWTNATGSQANPGDVQVLNSGSTGLIGITIDTTANGAQGAVEIEDVHTLTKNTGEAFTQGQILYWDATNKRLTGTATANTRAGRASEPAASAATSANCSINQA
jgi:predicted RecA/RadA family phage recombinase